MMRLASISTVQFVGQLLGGFKVQITAVNGPTADHALDTLVLDGTQRAKHTSQIVIGDLQLIMNTAVGGDFDGNPVPATVFPAYQRIDYVRVYRDTANVR